MFSTKKNSSRSSLRIMMDVVFALMMREVQTRFGATRLGFFWAIAEPVLQVCIFGFIYQVVGRKTDLSNIPFALFLSVSIVPYQFIFKKMLIQISAAVHANKQLLSYQPVHPIDPVIARCLIELALCLISFVVILSFMAWLGYEVMPDNLFALIAAFFLLTVFSIGLGLIACVAKSYYEEANKIVDVLTRPLLFISGVFFAGTTVPQQFWYLCSWNPIFNALDLSRDAFFAGYTTPFATWSYLALCAVISFSLGLVVFYVNRLRFLTL